MFSKNTFLLKCTDLYILHPHLPHESSRVYSFHYERNPKDVIHHLCSSPHQAIFGQFLLHNKPQILLLWHQGIPEHGKRHHHPEYPKNHHRLFPSQTQGHKSRLFHSRCSLNHSV